MTPLFERLDAVPALAPEERQLLDSVKALAPDLFGLKRDRAPGAFQRLIRRHRQLTLVRRIHCAFTTATCHLPTDDCQLGQSGVRHGEVRVQGHRRLEMGRRRGQIAEPTQ